MHSKSYYERTKQLKRRMTVMFGSLLFVILFVTFTGMMSTKSSAADSVETYKYYTMIQVNEGDTLTSIASEHMDYYPGNIKNYISEVCYMNGIEADTIYAGESLVIPYYSPEYK